MEFDGVVANILTVIRNRSPLQGADLRKLIVKQIEDDEGAEAFRDELVASGWIEKKTVGWVLTEEGGAVLAEEATGVSTELEDEGVADHPLKPYDVAKLKVEQKPLSIFQALRKIEKKEIILDPEFQRAFVWDVVKQSRLIESILIRIPLPAFYLDATDEVRWSVVDGLQRLTTLNRFCRDESFALTGLEFLGELSGLRFSELPQKYQVLIEDDTQLIFNNLLPGTPIKAKFTIFSRVNTGGMQLTPQEIRHALQQGPVTKLLRTLASSSIFLNVTARALDPLRMVDREVILRAISFMKFGAADYRRYDDLNAFLVDSMERFNRLPSKELDGVSKRFLGSLPKVYIIFDRYSFRKYYQEGGRRSPFNKALFESWIAAVEPYSIEVLQKNRKNIRSKFLEHMNEDSDFVNSITYGTGQQKSVAIRFDKIESLLRSVCG